MKLNALWESLQATKLGDYIASSTWAFPTLESLHVIAIVSVMGTITIMDLRLLGLTSRSYPVMATERDTLRWTWGAFVLASITGGLLFISKAASYAIDPWFIWKMILIVVAGLNMAVFHLITWRSVEQWDGDVAPPLGARIAGATSLVLWIVVAFCGRAIGFTLSQYQQ